MSSLKRPSSVALAWHKAGSSTPFGVTKKTKSLGERTSHNVHVLRVGRCQSTNFIQAARLPRRSDTPACPPLSLFFICWAEARVKIARMNLTFKLDGNWSSFQLANSAPPLSVTDSAIAPSARMTHIGEGGVSKSISAQKAELDESKKHTTNKKSCRKEFSKESHLLDLERSAKIQEVTLMRPIHGNL